MSLVPLPRTLTADLYRPLHDALVGLLEDLEPGDWERPTVAGAWQVRDVVAHLVDVDLRRLSSTRDGHRPPPDGPLDSWETLVGFLNELNATWTRAARRLSPGVLLDLVRLTGPLVADLVRSLHPDGEATFPVSWAGESRSAHWMDIGRDYTERWHHQQQIRDAVGASGLLERRWFHPVLELSVRALPRAYEGTGLPEGTAIVFEVPGDAGGRWTVRRDGVSWTVWGGAPADPSAVVQLEPDNAWRLLYHALPPELARGRAQITGDPALAEPLFRARAVMVGESRSDGRMV